MCGLAVQLLSPGLANARDVDLHKAMEAMAHRGTLEPTYANSSTTRFGHVRLPIQSTPETGHQPFRFKNPIVGSEVAVYVGEIFNMDSAAGPDSFQACELLTKMGPEVARHFDGFFSVVFTRGDSVFALTDHLGIKPLYYDENSGMVASELKAFMATAPLEFDELYFSNVIKFGYDISDRTPFKSIRRIKPGHFWEFRNGKLVREECYFPLKPDPVNSGELHRRLSVAVRRRLLRSNLPVAILCSGGLDSSLVAVLALKHRMQEEIKVYHVDNDEAEFVHMIDWPDNVTLTALSLGDNMTDMPPALEEILLANETPVDLGSVTPQYLLAQALKKENIHVALSGDGADELFGGYRRAREYDSQMSDVFCELPAYHHPRLDALMMSGTVELRSPFVAPSVVRAALGLPYKNRTDKQMLKKIARFSGVPEAIIEREKKPLKSKNVAAFDLKRRVELCDYYREVVKRFAERGIS